MNSNKVQIELVVDDKGSVTMKQFGQNTEDTFEKSKGHALAYAAVAAAALYALSKAFDALWTAGQEWVSLAEEQERAEQNLNAVLTATGEAAGYNLGQLKAMAAGMQETTTVGDEVVLSGMAMLATFKQIRGEGFERATQAALDMSQVLETDMKSSVIMIGKALNDPITNLSAMTRAGVQFTEQQKDQIKEMWKFGDAAGAQAIILGELESQFGGAAAAARETFGGALTATTNDLGDLKEELGFVITKNEFMIELVGLVGEQFKAMGEYVQDNRQYLQELVKSGILWLVDGLLTALETMRAFSNGWSEFELIASQAIHVVAVALDELFQIERMLLIPLDLIFEGLVKLGALDVNPFDSIEEGLAQFRASSGDVTAQVLADIEKTNRGYDTAIATVQGWRDKIAEIPVTQAESSAAVVKAVKDQVDTVTAFTDDQLKAFAALGKGIEDSWFPETTKQKSDEFYAAQSRGLAGLTGDTANYAKESTQIYETLRKEIQAGDTATFESKEKALNVQYEDYKKHLTSLAGMDQDYADGLQILDVWLENEKGKILDEEVREHGDALDVMALAWEDFAEDSLNASKDLGGGFTATMQGAKDDMTSILVSGMKGDLDTMEEDWSTFCDNILDNILTTIAQMVIDIAAQKITMFFTNAWDGDPSGKGTIETMLGIDVPFLTFASGGEIPGAYNGRPGFAGDTVPIMATPGEYMVRREAVQDPFVRQMLDTINRAGPGAGEILAGKNIPSMMGMFAGGIVGPDLGHYGFFSDVWDSVTDVVSDVVSTAFSVFSEVTSFLSNDDIGRALALAANIALAYATGGATIPYQLAAAGTSAGVTVATGGDIEDAFWNANTAAATAGAVKGATAWYKGTELVQIGDTWVEVSSADLTTVGAETMYSPGTSIGMLPVSLPSVPVTLPTNDLGTYWSIASQAPAEVLESIKTMTSDSWESVKGLTSMSWDDLVDLGMDKTYGLTGDAWTYFKELPSSIWDQITTIPDTAWDFMASFDLATYLAEYLPTILSHMQLSLTGADGGEGFAGFGERLGIMGGGGLSRGPYIGGERGQEWAVPTYEPERSQFLRDVGADPDHIAAAIAKKLPRDGGGSITFNLYATVADRKTMKEFAGEILPHLEKLKDQGY